MSNKKRHGEAQKFHVLKRQCADQLQMTSPMFNADQRLSQLKRNQMFKKRHWKSAKMKLRLRRKKVTPPNLFDSDYYLSQNDALKNIDCPWDHYCKVGAREGLNPNPLFSTRHYQNVYLDGALDENPLLHYLNPESQFNNPHSLFDSRTYLAQIGNPALNIPVLEHFLTYNNENHASPSVFFDTKRYLFANPEVAPCGFVGLYHFIRYGKMQGRDLYIDQSLIADVFNRSDRPDYDCVMSSHQQEVRFLASVLSLDESKPTVVIAANKSETEFTGITKQVSRELSEVYDVNTIHIFGFGAAEAEQFTPFGPSFCLTWEDAKSAETQARNDCAAGIINGLNPVGVIYFDCHPSRTLTWLSDSSAPVHAVIPRLTKGEFDSTIEHICKSCETVTVPSALANSLSDIEDSENREKIQFTDTDFESLCKPPEPYKAPAQIKTNMGLDQDSVLVVGSGDISYENGFDRFISVAVSAILQSPSRPLQFLWVGTIPANNSAQAMDMLEELNSAQLEDRLLICEDSDLQFDAIHSADILLLTQRNSQQQTPVGEFLEAGRPIVWFQGNTQIERLLKQDPCGVSPGNMPQAVETIMKIVNEPEFARQLTTENRKRREKATSIADFVYQLSKPLVYRNIERQSKQRDDNPHIIKMPRIIKGKRDKRRVIFTAPNWQISGVNTFIETLVNELNELDFEAHVLFTTTQAMSQQKALIPDMPYHLLTQEPNARPKRRKELLHSYLAAMAPCVFVPNYDYIASTVSPELQDNIATLGVLHSDDPQHYVHGYRMGPYWDAIVSVSQTIEDKLLALNSSFADKSSVIRYGIRDEGKTIAPRSEGTTDKLRVVYTGRIIQQQKLIMDFVDVAKKLNEHRDKFEMIFVGDGPQLDEFAVEMQPYVNSGLVQLLGRIHPSQISDVLNSSHVFSLTSEFEGLPLSMLEALGAGLVPVVTDVESGIGEICTHEKNALISPIGQPEALADNLIRLANSPELFNRLSVASRQTFLDERLRAVDMAEQYAVVLDQMFDNISNASSERTDKLIYCPNIERLLNVA